MARVVVAGAGAIGASIAYHLALRGADDVVLADVGEIAGGATGKAMGGVRQQFTTEAEVRLAQASVRLFRELGAPLFEQVGYLFLATTRGRARRARGAARDPGVARGARRERRRVRSSTGLRVDDVLGATICREDGIADPAGVTRELVRRAAALGVDVRERTDALSLEARHARGRLRRVLARGGAGARRRASGPPARPAARRRRPGRGRARGSADDDRGEHLSLPPRRSRRAAARDERAGAALGRAGGRCARTSSRTGASAWRFRYPRAAGATVRRAWAGFYDMTPDAHPIIGQRRRRALRRLRLLRARLHAVPGGG